MADMPSSFWGGWIVVLTVTSFIALVWFVRDVYRKADHDAGTEDEVWDETLREGARPAPLWWFWFILALMTFSVVYVMLYPGLGAYQGALKWSQGGQIAGRFADYEAQFGSERRRLQGLTLLELAGNPMAMKSAWRIFNDNCSSCHGGDAAGQASLFPDLTDNVWQWGGDEAQLLETIRSGRQAAMPAWGSMIGPQDVEQLADHVLGLKIANSEPVAASAGATLFEQYCGACHGPTGSGQAMLGAPALNGEAWLYGGEHAQVIQSITNGRDGVMPAFGSRLDETQIRLLAAWLSAGARIPDDR